MQNSFGSRGKPKHSPNVEIKMGCLRVYSPEELSFKGFNLRQGFVHEDKVERPLGKEAAEFVIGLHAHLPVRALVVKADVHQVDSG